MKKKIENNIPFKFSNEKTDDVHTLVISGAIGEGGWYYEATSANDVREALEKTTAKKVVIKLNSGGGDAMAGIEIKNYLESLDKHVTVEVTALAASAASIIAMGADEVIMLEGSTMMIHQASTMTYGTKTDIQKTMNALEAIDDSLADIYVNKTGLSKEEISDMLKAETWLTAAQAVEKGFATSVKKEVKQDEEIENLTKALNQLQNELNEMKNQKNVGPAQVDNEPAPIAASARKFFGLK